MALPRNPSGRRSIRRQKAAATQGERLGEYSRNISSLTMSRPRLFTGRIEGVPVGLLGKATSTSGAAADEGSKCAAVLKPPVHPTAPQALTGA